MQRLLVFVVLGVLCLPSAAQPGVLDSTWGSDGVLNIDIQGDAALVTGVAVDPLDRVVVLGWEQTGPSDYRPVVARLLSDGVLDTSFGGNGIVRLHDFPLSSVPTLRLALHPDGRPAIAMTHAGAEVQTVVVMLREDGTIDPTFGESGVATAPHGFSVHDSPSSIIVETDGKVVLLTSAPTLETNDMPSDLHPFGMVRFTASGELDASFQDPVFPGSTAGAIRAAFGATRSSSIPAAFARQEDGVYVVAGQFYLHNGPAWPAVMRTSWGPDNAFGIGGVRAIEHLAADGEGEASAIASVNDGILVAGRFSTEAGAFSFARLTPDGQLDPHFGEKGVSSVSFKEASDFPWPHIVSLLPDGAGGAIGVGSVWAEDMSRIALARVTQDGSPDETFGDQGRVILMQGTSSFATAAAVEPHGRVYVGGHIGGEAGLSIVRYLAATSTAGEQPPTQQPVLGIDAYPNPAVDALHVEVHVVTPMIAEVVLYDVQGRRVRVLHHGSLGPGRHSFELDTSAYASGAYVVRIESATAVASETIVIAR